MYNIPEKDEKVCVNQPTSDAGKRFVHWTFVLLQMEHSHRLPLFSEAKESEWQRLK